MAQRLELHVSGTHCHACKILIEEIISEQAGVEKVEVHLAAQRVCIDGDFSGSPEQLATAWSALLAPHSYQLSLKRQERPKQYGVMLPAILLGLIILGLFFWLQKSGLLNLGFEGGLTPTTALLIGVIASLSSCLAIVGGLILSLAASAAQDMKTVRPLLFFHGGRLLGFAGLGAVLGWLGSALAINHTVIGTLGVLVAAVMIVLGINLLDIFHWAKSLQVVLPRHFFQRLTKIENGFFAPFLVGVGTFFLPCGFTQSMQLAALSSGAWATGAMIMGVFALGTLPMLAILSFGSFRFAHTKHAGLFFKTAGVVVIGLGVFSLLGALTGLGIIEPL